MRSKDPNPRRVTRFILLIPADPADFTVLVTLSLTTSISYPSLARKSIRISYYCSFMYTGGLLTPERATFDKFLSPNATPWDEPPTSTAAEALHEEEGDSDSFRSTLADQSNFSTSLPTGHSFNNALPTRPPYTVPASTATPSRALSASPAASFLSSFFNPAPETPKPDDEGQVIAGYTLGTIIGYGSTSIIRRASSSSGAQAAVKIVRRSDLVKAGNAPQARRKLQHEAAIWATLSHEHILPLFSAVHTTYADYFFTLYCPAGSLFDILKRDGNPALPQDDAGMMFRQIVRGMRYLHEVAHYVHRDMKLENVLVDEMGVCKICDFGMSRKIGSVDEENEEAEEQDLNPIFHANSSIHRAQTLNIASNRRHVQLNHVLNRYASSRQHRNSTSTNEPTHVYQPGSLPYAAPELLLPQTSEVLQPHPSQDIWALGVMLYALLTGKLPFQDSFEPRLQMKILNGEFSLSLFHSQLKTLFQVHMICRKESVEVPRGSCKDAWTGSYQIGGPLPWSMKSRGA